MSARLSKVFDELRELCLSYPLTREDHPWGHSAFKVKEKAFVISDLSDSALSVTVKLDKSRFEALEMPFAEPTGYGLGKSGWVTSRFEGKDQIPVGLLEQWIDESFRLIAPKKLLKSMAETAAPAKAKPVKRKKKVKAARR